MFVVGTRTEYTVVLIEGKEEARLDMMRLRRNVIRSMRSDKIRSDRSRCLGIRSSQPYRLAADCGIDSFNNIRTSIEQPSDFRISTSDLCSGTR